MDSRQSPIRRSMTQRHSIRSSKRLARSSSSGISPLARHLLKTQHEQKKAILDAERAIRRERFNPLSRSYIADDDDEEEEENNGNDHLNSSTDFLQPAYPELNSPFVNLCSKRNVQKKTTSTGEHVCSKKLRAVRRRVSKVVARVFRVHRTPREQDDAPIPEPQLRSFRRMPCTEL